MQKLRAEAGGQAPRVMIGGSDIDPDAIAAARRNAARAGADAWISFDIASAGKLRLPPGPGLILANPPYGRRIRASDDVYRMLGRLARESGWELALLTADERLAALAARPSARIPLVNGGTRVALYRYALARI
jgi:23S rRNA G2445 N2-methylase RlmL